MRFKNQDFGVLRGPLNEVKSSRYPDNIGVILGSISDATTTLNVIFVLPLFNREETFQTLNYQIFSKRTLCISGGA